MNIVGLITEYNPFHKGHEYHIQKAKELTDADICVVIMSGNYVQRGTPAFIDKHTRTRVALHHGADIIFELPVPFSCASAEYFSTAAVTLLHKLGVITHICFGAECQDITILDNIADVLAQAKNDIEHPINHHIKKLVKTGISYATARNTAISAYTGQDVSSVLHNPNNILAIEYIKALKILNSHIKPVAIARAKADYHDNAANDSLYSASSVRAGISAGRRDILDELITFSSEYDSIIGVTAPITEDDFSSITGEKILSASIAAGNNGYLTDYAGIDNDLSCRIISHDILHSFTSFSDLTDRLKTKNIAYTAISRAILSITLGIKKDFFSACIENDIASYIRLLGFKKDTSFILNNIKKNGELSIIGQLSEISDKTTLSTIDMAMLSRSIYCDELYNMIVRTKYHISFPNEYARKLIII